MTQAQTRIAALRAAMKKEGVDLVAIGPDSHMDWLLGFHPHPDERPCLLLVTEAGETMLMPALNAEGSREMTDISFHCWADDEGPDAALATALAWIGASTARNVVVDEMMRADFALLLLDRLPGARHSFTQDTLGALRMRKDGDEYSELKMNAGIADRAMQKAFAALSPGMTETGLATIIKSHFADEGAVPSFWIVGAGQNGAFPHHQAGSTVIKPGDAVVIDIGGKKGRYCSDITRMAVVGEPPAGYAEVHAVVEAAVQAALAAARPGVEARMVDKAARDVIEKAGYGEYFVHRTGHGMGIDGHEPPYVTSVSTTILDEGMVFSIEPGIYLPGRFGIRLEEIVILRQDGPEILSGLPRDVVRIPA
jgi:Xaa-Pro aminopeptidase